MLSVVVVLPCVPTPRVSDGASALYAPPSAPCEAGVLTSTRPALSRSAKVRMRASSSANIVAVCPSPPWALIRQQSPSAASNVSAR